MNITCKYAAEVLAFSTKSRYDDRAKTTREVQKVLEAFGDQLLPEGVVERYNWKHMVSRYKKYQRMLAE
jgi:hypothetical protein